LFKHKPDSNEAYQLFLESSKHDYALIKLERSVEIKNHNYPVLVPGFREEKNKVTVCGYKEVKMEQYHQMSHANDLQFSEDGGCYDIDTIKGQSGSPVYFMKKSDKEEIAHVVGIHKGFDRIVNINLCTLIT